MHQWSSVCITQLEWLKGRKTKLSRLEGPKAGTKGHKLEVGAQRAPRLSLTFSQGGPGKERFLKRKKSWMLASLAPPPDARTSLTAARHAGRRASPCPVRCIFLYSIFWCFFILHLANCSLACSRDTYWWDAHRISDEEKKYSHKEKSTQMLPQNSETKLVQPFQLLPQPWNVPLIRLAMVQ